MAEETAATSPRREQVERLFRAEAPGMVQLATLLVRDRAAAEELVQDAFVQVYDRLDGVERPGAYLRTTVVNLCRNHRRHTGVRQRHLAHAEVGTQAPPGLPAELSEVRAALDRLPDRQREAVILRYLLDLSTDQIAEHLGARPGTVRSLISRGLAQLEKELTP